MKVKSSVLLGLIMLFCLMGGLALLSRLKQEKDVWSPADMYSTVGGSHGSAYTTVSYGSASSAGSSMPVYLKSGSTLRRRAAFSYAHVMPSPNRAGGSSVYTSTSSPQGGLYTTSSAEFRSFGGGNVAGSSMSYSSRKTATPVASAAGLTMTMPSTPVYAYSSNSSNVNDNVAAASAVSTLPMYAGVTVASTSSYAGIGYTTASGSQTRGVSGRYFAPPGGTGSGVWDWSIWLNSLGYGDGFLYVDEDGNRYYDMKALEAAFSDAKDNYPDLTWEEFMEWFNNQEGSGIRHYVPIGDAWCVLLLALVYAVVVYVKRRKANTSINSVTTR